MYVRDPLSILGCDFALDGVYMMDNGLFMRLTGPEATRQNAFRRECGLPPLRQHTPHIHALPKIESRSSIEVTRDWFTSIADRKEMYSVLFSMLGIIFRRELKAFIHKVARAKSSSNVKR